MSFIKNINKIITKDKIISQGIKTPIASTENDNKQSFLLTLAKPLVKMSNRVFTKKDVVNFAQPSSVQRSSPFGNDHQKGIEELIKQQTILDPLPTEKDKFNISTPLPSQEKKSGIFNTVVNVFVIIKNFFVGDIEFAQDKFNSTQNVIYKDINERIVDNQKSTNAKAHSNKFKSQTNIQWL